MNQNELAVFAYACQLLLNNKLYDDLNKLLEFAKNKGVIVTPPSDKKKQKSTVTCKPKCKVLEPCSVTTC